VHLAVAVGAGRRRPSPVGSHRALKRLGGFGVPHRRGRGKEERGGVVRGARGLPVSYDPGAPRTDGARLSGPGKVAAHRRRHRSCWRVVVVLVVCRPTSSGLGRAAAGSRCWVGGSTCRGLSRRRVRPVSVRAGSEVGGGRQGLSTDTALSGSQPGPGDPAPRRTRSVVSVQPKPATGQSWCGRYFAGGDAEDPGSKVQASRWPGCAAEIRRGRDMRRRPIPTVTARQRNEVGGADDLRRPVLWVTIWAARGLDASDQRSVVRRSLGSGIESSRAVCRCLLPATSECGPRSGSIAGLQSREVGLRCTTWSRYVS